MHDHISERTGVILEHVTTIAGLSMIRRTIYQRMKDELVFFKIIVSYMVIGQRVDSNVL